MLILFLLFAKPGTSNTNLADAAFISKIDIIYIFIFFAIIVCAAIGVQNDFSRTSLFLNCIFTNYIKHSHAQGIYKLCLSDPGRSFQFKGGPKTAGFQQSFLSQAGGSLKEKQGVFTIDVLELGEY